MTNAVPETYRLFYEHKEGYLICSEEAKKGSFTDPYLRYKKEQSRRGRGRQKNILGRGENMAVTWASCAETEPGVYKGRCMCPEGSRISTGCWKKNFRLYCNPNIRNKLSLINITTPWYTIQSWQSHVTCHGIPKEDAEYRGGRWHLTYLQSVHLLQYAVLCLL